MANLGDITATLVADIKQFEAKMDTAKKLLGEVEGGGTSAGSKITSAFKNAEAGSKKFLGGVTAVTTAITAYVSKATLTAARTETMGIAMEAVAKATKTSTKLLAEQEATLKKQGITTQESRNILTKFMQSQLKVADASKIARVAQDLAVISGENSSETTARLTDAIATMNPELLRSVGIVQNQTEVFERYGKILKKDADDLTTIEKKQAIVNLIMEEGKKVTGAYEMAMETAGKKMGSLKRYFEEAENTIGAKFLPVFNKLIDRVTEFMKGVTPEKVDEVFGKINEWLPLIAGVIIGVAIPSIVALGASIWSALAPLLPFIAAGTILGIILKENGIGIEEVSAFIKNSLVPALISAKEWIERAWKTIKEKWEEYGQPVFDYIVYVINTVIIPAWNYLKDKIKDAMEESGLSMEQFKAILKVVAFVVGFVLLGAIVTIISVLGVLMFAIGGVISIITSLYKQGTAKFQQLKDNIKWYVDKVKSIFSARNFGDILYELIIFPFEIIARKVGQIFNNIKNTIQDALDLTKRHSPSVIDRLKMGIGLAEKELNKISGIQLNPISQVFQQGLGASSGGAISLSIDMSGANISSPEIAQDYAEKIGDAIVGKLRTNRRSYV